MNEIIQKLYLAGIAPVVVIDDAKDAVPLAKTLEKNGILTAEITFRTPAAQESIKQIAKQVPGILVGAGTVTDAKMAKLAHKAGAKYIVSPGLSKGVVQYCLENDLPVFPGVSTPTEIEAAMELGLDVLKFFPAEQCGGKSMLSALYSPFKNIKFIPTGGINLNNLNDYLDLENVIACGGSWLCPASLINANKFDEIGAMCKQAVLKMHSFSLLHIGVNSSDDQEAKETTELFSEMFSLGISETPASYFSGTMMEIMKSPFLGTHGHIAISVNNMDRAMAYFENRGFLFRPGNIVKDDFGPIAAYFEQEVGGFAVHLRRKL